jgi:hypothetical protein
MSELRDSYKKATGKAMPAVSSLVGKMLLKINAASQNLYVRWHSTMTARY